MSNELIINASLSETRIALLESGEIQELLIERASDKGIVGNIYKGKVTRVLPGMQAAFVDIGLEKAAFLYVDDVQQVDEMLQEEQPAFSPLNDGEGQILLEEASGSLETSESAESVQGGHSALSPIIPRPSVTESVPGVVVQPHSLLPEDAVEAASIAASDISDVTPPTGWMAEVEDYVYPEGEDDPEDMGPEDGSGDGENSHRASEVPEGVIAPSASEAESVGATDSADPQKSGEEPRRRYRRGRRGSRFRRRPQGADTADTADAAQRTYPESYHEQLADTGNSESDRVDLAGNASGPVTTSEPQAGRPEGIPSLPVAERIEPKTGHQAEFKAQRTRDRRIRTKASQRPLKAPVNIQDLLKEGQEVLVQVAKDPIATKGARLTCHISLPGRHLVCMPTIDHVGVSRRIEREDERRRLREYVEKNRTKNLGFIVRTASGKQQSEKRIKQDIDYLTRLWSEIREKATTATAPALVYEDLNAILRAIRDWVTEEIDKVIVDSRHHFNEIQRFVGHFMPSLKQKVELYHGDVPIFDAYGISTELSRALERKVWLKSGGYIVIDQAEALVAIDVNTGRYVGRKNLEDTILKTNMEAVQEIAYQLRLRNCGGIIILDLIDMEKEENKQRVYRALENALLRDRARPSILKISELGLVEMTRKRTRDTIIRTLCESCSHCEGKGFIKSKQTVAYEVMREVERAGIDRDVNKILVQAHPDVIDILAIDERETLDQLEKKYRKWIYLQAVTDFHNEQFEVTSEKRDRVEKPRDHREHSGGRDHHQGHHRFKQKGGHHHQHPSAPSVTHSANEPSPIIPNPIIIPVSQPVLEASVPVIVPAAVVMLDSQDGGADEEDRLAFLRAQAAQDAALARLGTAPAANAGNVSGSSMRANTDLSRGEKGPHAHRNPRGRRGGNHPNGKFRRGFDRRAVKQFGYQSNAWNGNETLREPTIIPVAPAETVSSPALDCPSQNQVHTYSDES